jgi:hypothetical protein
MTEAEWLTSEDAKEMCRGLREQHGVTRRKAGKRKLKLFGCASCRLFGAALGDPRSLAAVEYMERFADREVGTAEMEAVKEEARRAIRAAEKLPIPPGMSHDDVPERQAAEAAFALVGDRPDIGAYAHWAMRSFVGASFAARHRNWLDQLRALSDLLRDIFGNPFRAVKLAPAWLTSDVVALARGIYDDRAFDRMPILADALQDAGCDNDDVLDHCRDPHAVHVRGCWVVDLVLGKA